LNILQEWNE